VLEAMGQALQTAIPQTCNSDQGIQFTSLQWVRLLQDAGVSISMDGKGRAMDNIFVERVWRTVKYEEVHLHDYANPREARQGLSRYFDFYNYRRLHQALDYCTPWEVYSGASGARPPRGAPGGTATSHAITNVAVASSAGLPHILRHIDPPVCAPARAHSPTGCLPDKVAVQ